MSVLTTVADGLINTLGPLGIGLGLTFNSLGIPIPSEILLPLGGVGIKTGQFNVAVVLFAGVAGQLVGLVLSYAIGRYGGIELIERYGRYVGIRRHDLDKAQIAFDRYGGRIVFFGLILPGIHGYVGYPAGIAKMNPGRFIAFATLGASIWAGGLIYLGYLLGNRLDLIDTFFRQFAIAIILIIAVILFLYIRRHRRALTQPNS